MDEWIEKRMVTCIVKYKEKVMTRYKNWNFSARIVGANNKKMEFFLKVKTVVNFNDLKNCTWENMRSK